VDLLLAVFINKNLIFNLLTICLLIIYYIYTQDSHVVNVHSFNTIFHTKFYQGFIIFLFFLKSYICLYTMDPLTRKFLGLNKITGLGLNKITGLGISADPHFDRWYYLNLLKPYGPIQQPYEGDSDESSTVSQGPPWDPGHRWGESLLSSTPSSSTPSSSGYSTPGLGSAIPRFDPQEEMFFDTYFRRTPISTPTPSPVRGRSPSPYRGEFGPVPNSQLFGGDIFPAPRPTVEPTVEPTFNELLEDIFGPSKHKPIPPLPIIEPGEQHKPIPSKTITSPSPPKLLGAKGRSRSEKRRERSLSTTITPIPITEAPTPSSLTAAPRTTQPIQGAPVYPRVPPLSKGAGQPFEPPHYHKVTPETLNISIAPFQAEVPVRKLPASFYEHPITPPPPRPAVRRRRQGAKSLTGPQRAFQKQNISYLSRTGLLHTTEKKRPKPPPPKETNPFRKGWQPTSKEPVPQGIIGPEFIPTPIPTPTPPGYKNPFIEEKRKASSSEIPYQSKKPKTSLPPPTILPTPTPMRIIPPEKPSKKKEKISTPYGNLPAGSQVAKRLREKELEATGRQRSRYNPRGTIPPSAPPPVPKPIIVPTPPPLPYGPQRRPQITRRSSKAFETQLQISKQSLEIKKLKKQSESFMKDYNEQIKKQLAEERRSKPPSSTIHPSIKRPKPKPTSESKHQADLASISRYWNRPIGGGGFKRTKSQEPPKKQQKRKKKKKK
jgi:hypothetical protein